MGERRKIGLIEDDDRISARDVLEAAPDALIIVNHEGAIVEMNAATEHLFGYRRTDLLGRPIEVLIPERYRPVHVRDRMAYRQDLRRRPMGAGPELFGLRADGSEMPVEISLSPLQTAGQTLVIAAIRDVSLRERAEAERKSLIRQRALYAQVSYLARHDALTGLANRVLLHDRLEIAIAAANRHGYRVAVLFLDLDRFKHVNDSLGHGVGDWLLESVAMRLNGSVRGIDTVSRQGGDEFVVVLSEVQRREDAVEAAAKIIGSLTGAHRVGPYELHVGGSIGIALYPDDGEDPETLIKHADIAMYEAKEAREDYRFFTRDMNARIVESRTLEDSLRTALDNGELVLHYQPKVALDSGAMIGAEALLRWHHPVLGLIRPERFVPVAEDTGLIVPIGQWVLREACRQAQAWRRAGYDPVPVAVNVSAIEFRSRGFLHGVRRILDETGIDPRLVEIEVTESVLMQSVGATAAVLHDLKALGLTLAVDDFGTGYSSLSYLTRFPIDALKVDQSFVREITSEQGSPIITAVISMGRSLKHRVIAEGVETPAQLAFLKSQQCEEGQGFHFSRPLVADDFASLLAVHGNGG